MPRKRLQKGALVKRRVPVYKVNMRHPSPNPQLGPAQSDWPLYGLIDDIRPALAQMMTSGQSGALATLVSVDGPSPRPVGAQMLIDAEGNALGYVSGGCVEGSIAILALDVIASGQAKRFVFGTDSPFKDIVLICGTRIEVVIEPVRSNDPTLTDVIAAFHQRETFIRHTALDQQGQTFACHYAPAHRLIVFGHDPVALATIQLARTIGLNTILVRDKGPDRAPEGLSDMYLNLSAAKALEALVLDAWSAVVTTTHDLDQDHEALKIALRSPCFYVGALGSKRRVEDRHAKLRADGLSATQIARLHAPVGLPIGAATPFEIAVSTLGDVIATRRLPAQ